MAGTFCVTNWIMNKEFTEAKMKRLVCSYTISYGMRMCTHSQHTYRVSTNMLPFHTDNNIDSYINMLGRWIWFLCVQFCAQIYLPFKKRCQLENQTIKLFAAAKWLDGMNGNRTTNEKKKSKRQEDRKPPPHKNLQREWMNENERAEVVTCDKKGMLPEERVTQQPCIMIITSQFVF